MADTHRKNRVPAVCEIAVKKNLLKIPESRAPAPNQVDLEAIDWLWEGHLIHGSAVDVQHRQQDGVRSCPCRPQCRRLSP